MWRHLQGFLKEPLWCHSGTCLQTNGYVLLFCETPPLSCLIVGKPIPNGPCPGQLQRLSSPPRFGGGSLVLWLVCLIFFTWYLLNAESIYGHFPNDVPCSLPKNWPPLFSCYTHAGSSSYIVLRFCPNIARTLPKHCPNFARTLPEHCPNIAWTLPEHCPNFARTLPELCPNSARILNGKFHN